MFDPVGILFVVGAGAALWIAVMGFVQPSDKPRAAKPKRHTAADRAAARATTETEKRVQRREAEQARRRREEQEGDGLAVGTGIGVPTGGILSDDKDDHH